MRDLRIRRLSAEDLDAVAAAVRELGGEKPRSQYERYLSEQKEGYRVVFVGFVGGGVAGYVTLNRRPAYAPFRDGGIPEIQDLNVLPRFRRRGVATRLLERAEREADRRSETVGIGVGLSADYGAAQRLYVLRGFVPDGRGVARGGLAVPAGDTVTVDDGLVLYMTKRLRCGSDRRDRG